MSSNKPFVFNYEVFSKKTVDGDFRNISNALDKIITRLNNGQPLMPHQQRTFRDINEVRKEVFQNNSYVAHVDALCNIALNKAIEFGTKHTVVPHIIEAIAEINKLEGIRTPFYRKYQEISMHEQLTGVDGYSGTDIADLMQIHRLILTEEKDHILEKIDKLTNSKDKSLIGPEISHLRFRMKINKENMAKYDQTVKVHNSVSVAMYKDRHGSMEGAEIINIENIEEKMERGYPF